MDGVIIDSESLWEFYEQKFLPQIMGKKIFAGIKDQILGNSIEKIYDEALSFGLNFDKNQFKRIYFQYAKIVYKKSKLTKGIEILLKTLGNKNIKLGLVTVSNKKWIDIVLSKFKLKNPFHYILSLDSEKVRPKPFPDGYQKAMKALKSASFETIIIEDSQKGIQAAKTSGALTICYLEHLPKSYLPQGADIYVKNVKELTDKIEKLAFL